MINQEKLIENFERTRARIALASQEAGRAADEVALVAVSKTVSREVILAAHDLCGQKLFGENRADVLRDKCDALEALGRSADIQFDFIGNLQRNKLRWVVGKARLIHSVDSLKILQAIENKASEMGIVQDLLLQVDIAQEESKSGLSEAELEQCLSFAESAHSIRVKGLMCMAPFKPAEEISWVFDALRETRDRISSKYQHEACDSIQLEYLSMGMSNDFEQAIAAGSDLVRVGSALFSDI